MAGRSTEYKESYVWQAREYLKASIDALDLVIEQQVEVIKDFNWSISNETKTTKVNRLNVKLPSIEWLAKYIKISRSTIYLWRDANPTFSDILEEILEEQAERLINMGLQGTYNWTITKLLLAKHWYIEKQEVENKVSVLWDVLKEIQGLNDK